VARRCVNPLCPAQRWERLIHFAGRSSLDIEGMGPMVIAALIEAGYVEDAADFFQLTREQVLQLDRFADRSADNLIASIAARRRVPLHRLLNALGVPHVGEHTALVLANHFRSLERLAAATEEDLLAVEGVGPTMAAAVARWFHGEDGRRLLAKLAEVGVEAETAPVVGEGPWTGQSWVLTGSLEAMSRPDAEERIRRPVSYTHLHPGEAVVIRVSPSAMGTITDSVRGSASTWSLNSRARAVRRSGSPSPNTVPCRSTLSTAIRPPAAIRGTRAS